MRAKSSRGVMVGALILVALGVVLLLNNFYFLGGFNVLALSPLLLLLLGAVILLRGDVLNGGGRNFGITRGSVESASLEVSAGAIDVTMRALTREGRLIAGQYAEDSRPQLVVDDAHAFLRLDRAATPFFAFADWEINLARDLPWDVYVSTSLGQADLDLGGLIVERATISTGFGDIRLICPQEAFQPIHLTSTLGTIRVIAAPGVNARVHVTETKQFAARVDTGRYEMIAPGIYQSRDADDAPVMTLYIQGTFGDAYLA